MSMTILTNLYIDEGLYSQLFYIRMCARDAEYPLQGIF